MEEILNKIFKDNSGREFKVINKISDYNYDIQYLKSKNIYRRQKRIILKGEISDSLGIEQEFINKEWPQKCGDSLRILKKSDKRTSKVGNYFYEVEFIKYPYKTLTLKKHIVSGYVKNPYSKSIFGVACFGIGKFTSSDIYYNIYSDLLNRCYCEKSDRYSYYGSKGVKICDEWLNYQNFAQWMFDHNYQKEWSIDKDILANINHSENKIYSPKTCLIIPYFLNAWLLGDSPKAGVFLNSKNRFYCDIQVNEKRKYSGICQSFKEAKTYYVNEKYNEWKRLIETSKILIPKDIKEILLQYDFSWYWLWENLNDDEIRLKFYNKNNNYE